MTIYMDGYTARKLGNNLYVNSCQEMSNFDTISLLESSFPRPGEEIETLAKSEKKAKFDRLRFHFLAVDFYFPYLSKAQFKALWNSSLLEVESAIFPKDSRSYGMKHDSLFENCKFS